MARVRAGLRLSTGGNLALEKVSGIIIMHAKSGDTTRPESPSQTSSVTGLDSPRGQRIIGDAEEVAGPHNRGPSRHGVPAPVAPVVPVQWRDRPRPEGLSMPRRKLAVAAAIVTMLAAATPVGAVTGPVDVSSPGTPFSQCTADDAAIQTSTFGSTVYPDSEVEPRSAIDPTNPSNIVGEYQQDRWDDGGARGLVASVSHDGGVSWARVVVPKLTKCSGGSYDRASDPWVSFGPDGTLYAISLSFDVFDDRNAILASRSTDGGDTWSDPVEITADDTGGLDKESITADPSHPGVVYAAWDRIVYPGGSLHASDRGRFVSSSYKSQTFFARSADGGLTWSTPQQVYTNSSYTGSIGSIIRVLDDGTLLDGLLTYGSAAWKGGACGSISILRSADGGTTWSSKPVIVAPLTCTYRGVTVPDTGDTVRTGGLPDIAVSGHSVYVVWEDAVPAAPTTARTLFSQSLDGGATWSAPIVIDKSPSGPAFVPAIAVNSAGTVGVTYYDFRNDTAGDGIASTDYWLVRCSGSCDDASSWSETRVTPTSFDLEKAARAHSLFLGDYEGMTTSGSTFQPFFIESLSDADPSDAFFASMP
jgi:hypothetical protein